MSFIGYVCIILELVCGGVRIGDYVRGLKLVFFMMIGRLKGIF